MAERVREGKVLALVVNQSLYRFPAFPLDGGRIRRLGGFAA